MSTPFLSTVCVEINWTFLCLCLCEVSRTQMVFKLQTGHKYVVEMAMFNVQRAMTQKYAIQSCGSCALHFISWYLTFM